MPCSKSPRPVLGLVCAAALPAVLAACSSSDSPASPAGDAGVDASDAQASADLPFVPTNVAVFAEDFEGTGDVVVSDASCTIHTERKEFSCIDSSKVTFRVMDQTNAPSIGVYFVHSLKIGASANLRAIGTHAIAIVSATTIDVEGVLTATPRGGEASPGGYRSAPTENFAGAGPGGGAAGSANNAGAGGSYCGSGGKGSPASGGVQALPGKTWGNVTITPLVGGASGGNGVLGHSGGSGGGAIQLVAGGKLRVAPLAVISAGGGGGNTGGAAPNQQGSGGGSGGVVLLEGTSIEVEGLIAVNGGGGGPSSTGVDAANGQDGLPSESPAQGGTPPANEVPGGQGSAGGTIDGADGTQSAGGKASGGGGGAGRIRMNAYGGQVVLGGKLSPPEPSQCVTVLQAPANGG